MFTDTHAHLDFPDYASDLDAVLERARAADITRIITISTSIEGSARAVALAEAHPQIRAAVGVHPSYVDQSPSDILSPLRALAWHPAVVAIGETGLDYHRNSSAPEEPPAFASWQANRKRQALFFEQQLEIALETRLNVVVHQRDSWEDTLAILRPYSGRLSAVFHCFGGTLQQAHALLELGFCVSFTGIVTFKNAATVQETAAKLPAGSFFLETDCPFLAPIPHRGKRCEPAHTRLTAEYIAALRGEPIEALAAHTNAAADAFFQRR
ncbi:MAG: TatD DNase family protein [Verrucomicrobia bacterium]|nr:MAG: TatD DNase family protein [Verrucomicrobiota bacterium]